MEVGGGSGEARPPPRPSSPASLPNWDFSIRKLSPALPQHPTGTLLPTCHATPYPGLPRPQSGLLHASPGVPTKNEDLLRPGARDPQAAAVVPAKQPPLQAAGGAAAAVGRAHGWRKVGNLGAGSGGKSRLHHFL